MSFKFPLIAGVAALSFALPAFADGIIVHDAYARASASMSQSGAAFMEITNDTGTDDRLIDARSDVAERVELHTHIEDDNGVMRMVHVQEGFPIGAGETHALARGGDHVMFIGLTREFVQDDEFELTLVFENAGEVSVMVPVDLQRNPMRQQMQGHGQMNHGNMGNMGNAASN